MASSDSRRRDPNYFPPLQHALPLGAQHVFAMFASNATPAILVGGAAGFAFGSAEAAYLIQMSMVFAGVATLLQSITLGPVGAKLPIMHGASFAFVPVMILIIKEHGLDALFAAAIICGIFHFFLGFVVGGLRRFLPPLVTGVIILSIGVSLIPVAALYAAGGPKLLNSGDPTFGGAAHWGLALLVVAVTLAVKMVARGALMMCAILIGLLAGYAAAAAMGMVDFSAIARAEAIATPRLMPFGFEIVPAAILMMCVMAIVSTVETLGDVSATTMGGAGREATGRELAGATFANGLGVAIGGAFGATPSTSFSQNAGLVALTGMMSRHVMSFAALLLIAAGFLPKVGAAIAAMPLSVLGGGVIILFGMLIASGAAMLAQARFNRRNMLVIALSLSVGIGLQIRPETLQQLPDMLRILLASGLAPAAILAIALNALLPERLGD